MKAQAIVAFFVAAACIWPAVFALIRVVRGKEELWGSTLAVACLMFALGATVANAGISLWRRSQRGSDRS